MGFDYALVHLQFTLPPALILTFACQPLLSRLDIVRIVALVVIAVTATIPWDSYLIRTGVWTYPDEGVLGFSLFSIPVEELFFFVIQSYITSLVYILCNKPVLQAQYLSSPETQPAWIRRGKVLGQVLLAALTALGAQLIVRQGKGSYLGLILAWACPFALISWSLSGEMILAMPWTSTALPILAPTFYLWLVDELSLRNGVWTIEAGTKLDWQLFGSLDIEEAVFFLATNALLVFGIAAFDLAFAVCDAFPEDFPEPADALPVMSLLKARFKPRSSYDMERVRGIKEAATRLSKKSRSFSLASSVFPGRLRIDLTLLYSYCRLADDLIDNASSPSEALHWTAQLRKFLDLTYGKGTEKEVQDLIHTKFEPSARSALQLLPTHGVVPERLYSLLEGFETDLKFEAPSSWPIHDEDDLELYASRVASTVGGLCLDLVFHHTAFAMDKDILQAAAYEMGIALQYVNIARDIAVDADMGRVYLPTSWLTEESLTPEMVIERPCGESIERMRRRLLGKAFQKYRSSRSQMTMLPKEARGPMVVAVESYMEIGRVLSEGTVPVQGRATVPVLRRMRVVWQSLMRA